MQMLALLAAPVAGSGGASRMPATIDGPRERH
jgi:hypothetical protein